MAALEEPATDPARPRHVLLLVLDGFTASHLNTYNPEAPVTGFDRLIEQDGLVMANYRTNAAWTHGFFGILYSGKKSWVLNWTDQAPLHSNLLASLQDHDVETRWITSHPNGMPESHVPNRFRKTRGIFLPREYRMNAYKGLRSVFLSENFSWFPAALGLSYNVASRGGRQPPRAKPFYKLLHATQPWRGIFDDFLIEELKQIRGLNRPSFVVAHTESGGGDFSKDPDEARLREAVARLDAQGKVAGPEDQWVLDIHQKRLRMTVAAIGAKVEAFIERLKAEGLYDDSLIMITADHGIATSERRFKYEYHPVEEVSRVPMILLNAGRTGIDDRLFETIDIAQTVFDYFSVPARLDERAVSMLSDKRKTYVSYLTLPNPVRPEWFLNIYRPDGKYIVNFHRDAEHQLMKGHVEGFDTRIERTGLELCNEIGETIAEVVIDYGLYSLVDSPC